MGPVFIDLETRSAADLKECGGYLYATHPTTRLLTVAWQTDGEDHVWMPGLLREPPSALVDLHLRGVRVHVGERVPAALCRVAHREWIGHNCWTFDRPVWAACTEGFEHVRWVDTYPLALAAGLPGGLDKIGKLLFDAGKDETGARELKKAYKATSEEDCEPCNVPPARQILIAKYNVQDTRLLATLWPVLERDAKLTDHERKVLAAHDAINDRGCRVDRPFVVGLLSLAQDSSDAAIEKIAALTCGALPDRAHVQSRAKVLNWLDAEGFAEFKECGLRKELVARFIDANRGDDETEQQNKDEDTGFADPDSEQVSALQVKNLSRVVSVLELRMSALRVTGGKLHTTLNSLDYPPAGADRDTQRYWQYRARGLFAYWSAHTGRWGGRRVQVQNLPRPKEGVDTWALLEMFRCWTEYQEHSEPFDFPSVLGRLPIGELDAEGKPLYPFLSADDASSGLLMGMFIPDAGDCFASADLANIEARVLEWCAGGKLQIFWDGGDPYMVMAERIFGKRESWVQFPDPKKAGAFLPLKKHPYRQVGKVVFLGAGYQLGAAKFTAYAAMQGIDLGKVGATPQACIDAYRQGNPLVAGEYVGIGKSGKPSYHGGLWRALNDAAITCVRDGTTAYAGRCTFSLSRGNMIITLPSGRRLVYRKAHIANVADKVPWDSEGRPVEAVAYWSPRYGLKYLYGGALAENTVQAIARDCMAHGMVLIEEHGSMPVVLHCHDSLVSSTKPKWHDEFMGRMTTCPPWLPGLPLDAEGGLSSRYSKTPPPGTHEQVWRNGKYLKGA